MDRNENAVEILNDLIRINNDRIIGYEKAADSTKDMDADLRMVFQRMAEESTVYAAELGEEVTRHGGEPTSGTTNSGKIYRVWMDLKATFTGHDRESLLASCEFGEDSAQTAYRSALDIDNDLTPGVRQLITNQKTSLKTAHDLIKKYRDMHKAVAN